MAGQMLASETSIYSSPAFKKSDVGPIPVDWDVKPLSALATMKSGSSITSKSISESGSYRCFGGNGLRGYTSSYTHSGSYALIGRQGALCGNVLRADGQFFASEHAIVVTARANVDVGWLTFILGEMRLNRYSESSAQPGLSVGKLQNLVVATPPTLSEQAAIAEALSDADALIASLEALIAKKQAIKQAVMRELLGQHRRFPGYADEWKEVTLEQCCAFITKGSTPTTYGFPWVESGILFLRSECVAGHGLDLSESMMISEKAHTALKRSEVIGGDILMTITGNVGRVVQLPQEFGPANINQHIARIRVTAIEMHPEFVAHVLNQEEYRRYYASILTGQAYPQIGLKQVRETVVPKPSLSEQKYIAEALSDICSELAEIEARLTKASHIKRGMMQDLLTGRVRLV